MSKPQCKKLLVMAGGTGGHIFPALAVADVLKQQGWEVCWLGTPGRMEATLVPEHGYPIEFIDVVGVRGNGIKRLLLAPFMVSRSIWQALKVIKNFKPDVVVGFGGFASGPGGVATWLKRIPLVLHEQNAVAGFTNRVLARFANKVLMAFPGTFAKRFNAELVGNPVRAPIVALAQDSKTPASQYCINVLIVGGSLGAQVLNQQMARLLAVAADDKIKLNVRHQTGKSRNGGDNASEVKAAYAQVQANEQNKLREVVVEEFIQDMAQAYRWADLVICRAGALTVSEVAAAGVAAIFVPFPHAVDDHQTLNAKWLADGGAAYVVQQQALDTEQVKSLLQTLLSQPHKLQDMAKQAKHIAILDAAERVANECKQLA